MIFVNICPGCKIKHDKQHKIINFDEKNYICEKHYENYTKYCQDCRKNICIKCDIEHKNHKGIYYGGILPDIRENIELKEYINKLKNDIEDIINRLKIIIDNMDIYYRISHSKAKNNKNRNYNYLQNLNEFINYNNKIIKDIKEIINDNNIKHKFENLMNIYDNINNIRNENNNYIMAEIEIKKDHANKDIRIINSYEQYKKENKIDDKENDYKYNNEKEIIENCYIKIENEIIPFSYFYKFKKEGKYKIKYSFKKYLTKTVFLFLGCELLTNIDLSNFDTSKITNMNAMFYQCASLKHINLDNINTSNVTDMCCLFYGCELLKNINLTNLETKNVEKMNGMFYQCKSLKELDLSNFNTSNVINMNAMFYQCESLKNINLSNFNTQNVTNMGCIFYGCKSLINIDLSYFNTSNVINMNAMFYQCESLKNINLS